MVVNGNCFSYLWMGVIVDGSCLLWVMVLFDGSWWLFFLMVVGDCSFWWLGVIVLFEGCGWLFFSTVVGDCSCWWLWMIVFAGGFGWPLLLMVMGFCCWCLLVGDWNWRQFWVISVRIGLDVGIIVNTSFWWWLWLIILGDCYSSGLCSGWFFYDYFGC